MPPKTRLGRFLHGGNRLDQTEGTEKAHPWHKILWLTGVDYFSTLAISPVSPCSRWRALQSSHRNSRRVTLFAAVPVYSEVAKRSYVGQGSIALLEISSPAGRASSCP